jgi:hypothetical protein
VAIFKALSFATPLLAIAGLVGVMGYLAVLAPKLKVDHTGPTDDEIKEYERLAAELPEEEVNKPSSEIYDPRYFNGWRWRL